VQMLCIVDVRVAGIGDWRINATCCIKAQGNSKEIWVLVMDEKGHR
jgi:hypothetical protein